MNNGESPSRDSSANPAGSGAIFYWQERATKGSSFAGIGKKALQRGIEEYSANSFKKNLKFSQKFSKLSKKKSDLKKSNWTFFYNMYLLETFC